MHQQPPPIHLPAHHSSCVVHQHLSKHSHPLSYPSDASNGYHKDTSAVPLRLIRPSHPNSAASRGPSLSRGRAGPRQGPRARLTFTFNTSPSLVKPSPSQGLWAELSHAQIHSCHCHLCLPTCCCPPPPTPHLQWPFPGLGGSCYCPPSPTHRLHLCPSPQ